MGAALFTSGPYIEMVISSTGALMTPTVEDGVVTWRVPLGEGAVPHVSLEDCGFYVRSAALSQAAVELRGLRCRENTSGPCSMRSKYSATCAKFQSSPASMPHSS